ncbi:serine hydroxymethyltransferase [Candidatus Desantisbacteria bacterium CG_4_10_14_0_8_um_filter_48_22]|uniref:Serine hydroxymethyltransferase n=1 Tax=Candidatus Desantisbacteria bacterium CG_4_10_14_0_8_um_filter_48_22 TaxID=1974543 RepID=A0A2M7SE71_9BACT|nr:MAG: serine hydroxymethyltransferase [Candidatus Desantisbacteria bacterium CG1_02_49_89]PIV57414.1 MAG: serine hydroxymethyltransferase [Candidatus Desantisbacteria bacterium CG02_land_8_20_14_3_00_49_13]PIZ17603.1 MAG: serine hydroxymethyltransferase [Candidatus Desantisbacteria bacterium CG_4_10_14_0_8_um_filter_48_22]PJB27812.1 MAG: serine hydroxymethyltransferase [Candidatus Desantisbacteria bacterium CG_4_9_14_3_um_filter_50_7]
MDAISRQDPIVGKILKNEMKRQQENLIMIASENYVSPAVLEAQGCIMTNKYAEGYPGKRFYQGCGNYDKVESLAISRAKKLFGAEHVNVQPHSGSQANMCVYFAALKPGDRILSMRLDQGGHLTHGLKSNFSGRAYRCAFYGVSKKTETIDYDEVMRIAKKFRPKLIVCGASSYPRIIDFRRFRRIADKCGAMLMADIAHIAGLVVGGVHPNPVSYCDFVTTTTHKTLRGGRGAIIMCRKKYADAIDRAVFPGTQGGPLMHEIAAKAVAFGEAMSPKFRLYQKNIVRNARILAIALLGSGIRLISRGTDNHLMAADVSGFGIDGKKAAAILEEAGIVVNKNQIPFDRLPPTRTSGIRIGTPAITSRGMGPKEMILIASWIKRVLMRPGNKNLRVMIKKEVKKLCARFPIYSK